MNEKTIHVRLAEWTSRGPDNFEALANYHFESRAEREAAENLARSGMLILQDHWDGVRVSARSFVGQVDIGSLCITVAPKLPSAVMLGLFQYAYGLRNLSLFGPSTFASDEATSLQELLCAQLYGEVLDLLQRGLHRRYEPIGQDLASPRGRIDLRALTGRGPLTRAKLPCLHHPRREDTPTNRAILAGVQLASRIAQGPNLRSDLRRLAARLAGSVSAISLRWQALDEARRQMNRLTSSYGPALDLIEVLLSGSSPSLVHTPSEAASAVRVSGFLFDMNRFFERLVGRLLRDNLPDYDVQDQRALTGMMKYSAHWNPKKRSSPSPRPDFTICGGARLQAILDAKYRDLWQTSLPREMLYQLGLYALSRGWGQSAAIIYPSVDPDATEARIEISPMIGSVQPAWVALRPLYIPGLFDAVVERNERALREMANRLAFGAHQDHHGRELLTSSIS